MSKRPRRNRKGKASAEDFRLDELPQNVVNGPAFEAYEAHLEQALEALEGRWSHVAAPWSLNLRRLMPLPKRRPTESA